eukprot:TRINITY_DN2151_c0_g1_i1.p1 TRINITY_DN2151_c0_g1~~TRINITY_DN2151_c0_g1_i1.p1  ORF type:complete len:737 (+),score=190.74 TRINITY_DN2151_c0_g1_i1:56-2266(+)
MADSPSLSAHFDDDDEQSVEPPSAGAPDPHRPPARSLTPGEVSPGQASGPQPQRPPIATPQLHVPARRRTAGSPGTASDSSRRYAPSVQTARSGRQQELRDREIHEANVKAEQAKRKVREAVSRAKRAEALQKERAVRSQEREERLHAEQQRLSGVVEELGGELSMTKLARDDLRKKLIMISKEYYDWRDAVGVIEIQEEDDIEERTAALTRAAPTRWPLLESGVLAAFLQSSPARAGYDTSDAGSAHTGPCRTQESPSVRMPANTPGAAASSADGGDDASEWPRRGDSAERRGGEEAGKAEAGAREAAASTPAAERRLQSEDATPPRPRDISDVAMAALMRRKGTPPAVGQEPKSPPPAAPVWAEPATTPIRGVRSPPSRLEAVLAQFPTPSSHHSSGGLGRSSPPSLSPPSPSSRPTARNSASPLCPSPDAPRLPPPPVGPDHDELAPPPRSPSSLPTAHSPPQHRRTAQAGPPAALPGGPAPRGCAGSTDRLLKMTADARRILSAAEHTPPGRDRAPLAVEQSARLGRHERGGHGSHQRSGSGGHGGYQRTGSGGHGGYQRTGSGCERGGYDSRQRTGSAGFIGRERGGGREDVQRGGERGVGRCHRPHRAALAGVDSAQNATRNPAPKGRVVRGASTPTAQHDRWPADRWPAPADDRWPASADNRWPLQERVSMQLPFGEGAGTARVYWRCFHRPPPALARSGAYAQATARAWDPLGSQPHRRQDHVRRQKQ